MGISLLYFMLYFSLLAMSIQSFQLQHNRLSSASFGKFTSINSIKGFIIGLGIFTQVGFDNVMISNALEDLSDKDAIQVQMKQTLSEEDRVKRKLELQKKSSQSSNINSYGDSLSREKEKQDLMKKSKVARSQDLCEVLGRGC